MFLVYAINIEFKILNECEREDKNAYFNKHLFSSTVFGAGWN